MAIISAYRIDRCQRLYAQRRDYLCKMQDMDTSPKQVARRLRAARESAGHRSAADAARVLKLAYGTYSGHENGSRGMGFKEITEYAQAFNVSPQWIAWGQEWFQKPHTIWGTISAHGEVQRRNREDELYLSDGKKIVEEILLPIDFCGKHAEAYIIDGNYFSPKFEDGDLLFFDNVYTFGIHERVGEWVIVDDKDHLVDGKQSRKFGQLQRGASELSYDLNVYGSYKLRDVARQTVQELYTVVPSRQVLRHLQRPENQPGYSGHPKVRGWL